MGVVFDEVVTQVEPPAQPTPPPQEPRGEPLSPQSQLRGWQHQLAINRRRQQRIEAD
jgi:hypothetical protein